jgi:hypothetical protein
MQEGTRMSNRRYLYGRTLSDNCRASPDGASAVALPEIHCLGALLLAPKSRYG